MISNKIKFNLKDVKKLEKGVDLLFALSHTEVGKS